MTPYQIAKKAEEFGLSIDSAFRVRIRYLLALFDQWEAYIGEEGIPTSDVVPELDTMTILEGIIANKEYQRRHKKGVPTNGITDDMVQIARQYPLSSLIEFDRAGFAPCFVHTEKTPSMKHYKDTNKYHCFGCGANGGPIDVLMAREGLTFTDAVRKLQ